MRINLDQKTVRLGPCFTKKGNFTGLMLSFLNSLSSSRENQSLCLAAYCIFVILHSSIMLLLQRSFTTKGHKVSGSLLVC